MNTHTAMQMISLDQAFGALADATRRAILMRLAQGDATVGELARPFAISLPAVSRHLKVLEEAELIFNERQGKHRLCRLNREALAHAQDWLDFSRRFWIGSLDRLDTHLGSRKREPARQKHNEGRPDKPEQGRKK